MLQLRVLKLLLLILVCCGGCAAIRVPVTWEDAGAEELNYATESATPAKQDEGEPEDSVFNDEPMPYESVPEKSTRHSSPVVTQKKFVNKWTAKKPIPVEYFEYPSNKPQFAVDVAKYHGVPEPQNQFRAHPIRAHTRGPTPDLGRHRMPQSSEPFYSFMNTHDVDHHLAPVSSNYEIFHPYKAAELGLQKLYNDPNLQKVRGEVEEHKIRLQKYEKNAGESNIKKDENLRSPEQTEHELFNQRYKPVPFEEYKPEKTPIYYTPPQKQYLPHAYLNRKLKYPIPVNHIKINPAHYQPLRHNLQRLRHQQANRYGDERNEYPQVRPRGKQNFAEPPEGHDIYEDGKKIFDDYRHNVDTDINEYSNKYSPSSNSNNEFLDYRPKDVQAQKYIKPENAEEEDFVPVKMYAQVRKTESIKHLPKEAAYEDAETLDELINAPRLKEAVKSTKAQTIYSEEGYEDNAYDHAGQLKHASNHEDHGGFLKQNENSGGRYKIPFVSHGSEDGDGFAAGNAYTHEDKWADDEKKSEEQDASEILKNTEEENDENEYDLHEAGSDNIDSENEPTSSLSVSKGSEKTTIMNENDGTSITTKNERMIATNDKHNVVTQAKLEEKNKPRRILRTKRNINFQVPELSLRNTFLTESEIISITNQKLHSLDKKKYFKYPYYLNNNINPNSPLRYAENLEFIPRKTKGGTEFYDSRTMVSCSEVESEVDPVPENLKISKEDENADNKSLDQDDLKRIKRQSDFSTLKKTPRLRGLGDKIDCFKEKYFGEDPLDSPFFSEELIKDPESLKEPIMEVLKLIKPPKEIMEPQGEHSEINVRINSLSKEKKNSKKGYFDPSKELTKEPYPSNNSVMIPVSLLDMLDLESTSEIKKEPFSKSPVDISADVYSDILKNIQSSLQQEFYHKNKSDQIVPLLLTKSPYDTASEIMNNSIFKVYLNKEDIMLSPPSIRLKRFAQFLYEPYKVIRENQDQDSKKTTTSGNISPLIKQLQTSKLVDQTIRIKEGNNTKTMRIMQPVKRNAKNRNYKIIHREDRAKRTRQEEDSSDFIDVSIDKRRGEPRYELTNHKAKYTPVTNSKALSREEYYAYTKPTKDSNEAKKLQIEYDFKTNSSEKPIINYLNPYFDVSAYIPKTRVSSKYTPKTDATALESINQPVRRRHEITAIKTDNSFEDLDQTTDDSVAKASNTPSIPVKLQNEENDGSTEEYEEYDEVAEPISTTTTTRKPIKIRRRIKVRSTSTTTTPKSVNQPEEYADYTEPIEPTTTFKPKNKIVRRFRKPLIKNSSIQSDPEGKIDTNNATKYLSTNIRPKIREKSVKTQKSTVITDSQSYGNNDDEERQEEDRKEQIDLMIGGQQNMRDYINDFEEANKENADTDDIIKNIETIEDFNSDVTSNVDEIEPRREINDRRIVKDYYDDRGNESKEKEGEESEEIQIEKPKEKLSIINENIKTKSSLPIVEAKVSRGRSNDYKVALSEKKSVRKNPNENNIKPLQMFKDENLAKDINKLAEKIEEDQHHLHSDVEVFKEELKLTQGPRHGGNYRSAQLIEELEERADAEPHPRLHGGNLKSSEEQSSPDARARELQQDKSSPSSAFLLNTLAQASTVLTTTPKYIQDPSKRMYYYVDAR